MDPLESVPENLGEDPILDFENQHVMKRLLLVIFLPSILFLLFSGCSFPRIIILKDPLTPEEHLNLGVAYERQGDLDNAIREYKMAARKIPRAYLYLGNSHLQKKEWKQAEEYYQIAIKKEPDNADAFNNLAWLYYTIGEKLADAQRLAQRAIELNPAKAAIYQDTLEKVQEMRKSLVK